MVLHLGTVLLYFSFTKITIVICSTVFRLYTNIDISHSLVVVNIKPNMKYECLMIRLQQLTSTTVYLKIIQTNIIM